MKNKLKIIVCLTVAYTVFSCSREETLNPESVITTNEQVKNQALDNYLKREFVEPYNIEVQYLLDDIETDFSYNVAPASKANAIKMINLLKYLCLDAYKAHTDEGFLKKYFPKTITLIGSGAYNGNGTVVLGTAQGGVKIVLYRINDIDSLLNDPKELARVYFNTIFHEFSHILHQNKSYTKDFEKISGSDYVGDEWNKYWSSGVPYYTKGFVSAYSSKEKNEDFVELISRYIISSEADWENLINPNGYNTAGVAIINQKLAIVKDYLRDSWNINLDDLRDEVQGRLGNLNNQNLDNIN